jgi:hypothetical protein
VFVVTSPYLDSLPTGPPITSYFGKVQLMSDPNSVANAAAALGTADPTATHAAEKRAACYSSFFQTLGISVLAPGGNVESIGESCRSELGMAQAISG